MQISASVKSRAMKRGSDNKVAKLLSESSKEPIHADVRDMVGKLELNATIPEDYFLLRELFAVLRGKERAGGGRIIIYDKSGKKVEDYLSVASDSCECTGREHNKVCVTQWRKENQ